MTTTSCDCRTFSRKDTLTDDGIGLSRIHAGDVSSGSCWIYEFINYLKKNIPTAAHKVQLGETSKASWPSRLEWMEKKPVFCHRCVVACHTQFFLLFFLPYSISILPRLAPRFTMRYNNFSNVTVAIFCNDFSLSFSKKNHCKTRHFLVQLSGLLFSSTSPLSFVCLL